MDSQLHVTAEIFSSDGIFAPSSVIIDSRSSSPSIRESIKIILSRRLRRRKEIMKTFAAFSTAAASGGLSSVKIRMRF